MTNEKKFTVALLLSILLGPIAADRFYLGYTGLGLLKLFTVGGFGVWYLIDVVMIATGSLQDAKGNALAK